MSKSKKKSIAFLAIFSILILLGIIFACVSLDKGQLGNVDYVAYPKAIKLGLDLKGGIYAEYSATRPENISNEDFQKSLDGTIKNFEQILFGRGFTEATVVSSGNRIRVEVPDVKNSDEILDLIGNPAEVLFKKTQDDNFEEPDVILTGRDLKNASVTYDQDGRHAISLEFNNSGTKKFADATSQLIGKKIHIYVNREHLMGPKVNSAITDGKAIITGRYTYDQANDLAIRIQSGSFPLKLSLETSSSISPTLGDNAIQMGLIAALIGLVLICVLLFAMYGLMGVAASLGLIYFTITYLFFLAIFPWVQLTLPGIAGILLSIGMVVDANVIIFERAKEEWKASNGTKSVRTCIQAGFKRSFSAILDGNITTILGGIVLMIFGVASIKGFAIVLLIGIIFSLFSSLVVSRLVLYSFLGLGAEKPELFGLRMRKRRYYVESNVGNDIEENISKSDDSEKTEIKEDKEKAETVEVKEEQLENAEVVQHRGKKSRAERKKRKNRGDKET